MILKVETYSLYSSDTVDYKVYINNVEVDYFDNETVTLCSGTEQILCVLLQLDTIEQLYVDTIEQLYEYLITISDKGEYVI